MSPRHDTNAERQVLGACLHDPRLLPELDLAAADFYHPTLGQLWDLLVRMDRSGEVIDAVTVGQALISDPIPGLHPAQLHQLMHEAFSTASAEYHAKILRGLSTLRAAEAAAMTALRRVQEASWSQASTVLEEARAALDEASARDEPGEGSLFADALSAAMDQWQQPIRPGVPTGWAEIDQMLSGGWKPGQLTIVGARPAVGKSALAGCAGLAAAEYGVAYYSLEMSKTEAVARIAAAAKRIEIGRLTRHAPTAEDWQKLAALTRDAASWRLMVDDRARLSMAQIRASVRSLSRAWAPRLVIIDYLQILRPADERADNRERQVNRLAEDCKLLAREFDTHVLALAQVGRGPMSRADKKPTMADLRESGGIEAHADNIILLHRDEERPGEIELIVEKNRHGRTGPVVLEWAPYYAQIR